MRWLRRGCGCIAVLLMLVVALPLAAVSCGGDGAHAGALAAGSATSTTSRAVSWKPLFTWTPANGEPGASAWPYGQCTWFVVSEGHAAGTHQVTWSGDAWQWYANAATNGLATAPPLSPPQPGWIAVYARGHGSDTSAGHVGVVVGVAGTRYTIAEANVLGLGVIDERTLPLPGSPDDTGTPRLEGWIP